METTTTGETSTSETSTGETSTGETSTVLIEIEGSISFETDCEYGDMECGAKAACEEVTGVTCMPQNYDCQTGAGLSFYPEGGEGMDSFNFAIYESIENFGNICACDQENFMMFNIPQLYDPCGEGNWRFVP